MIPIRYARTERAEVPARRAPRFIKGRIVAITGSNGKTTTTSLVGQMLQDAGMTQVGGTLGPLISTIDSSKECWSVVELPVSAETMLISSERSRGFERDAESYGPL